MNNINFTLGVIIGFNIIICIIIGVILNKYNKLNKHIYDIYDKLIDCKDNTNIIRESLYNYRNEFSDFRESIYSKISIIIRHSNNIRDNIQVTKLNTATILKNIETQNKAKISYTPNQLRKSSKNKQNGQEKLKTAKNIETTTQNQLLNERMKNH